MFKRLLVALCSAGSLFTAYGVAGTAYASEDKPVIALSNSFYGNTWRRQMVDAFTAEAEKAKAEGKIEDFVVLNGDGSVAQQNSQLAELILRGVDAIAINAASETALNGLAEKACAAGIKIIAFDSLLTADCAYKLSFDFTGYKTEQANATLDLIGRKGNVIVVRGVKGSGPDNLMYSAQKAVLDANPDVKVVAEVYGQATASEAQAGIANVLPSLPHVDAVLAQGGSDDFGIAQAFAQAGGSYAEKLPVIEGGGSSDFVIWWNEQAAKGYKTTSMNTTPGIGGAAFWLAYEVVKGAEPPKEMTMPVAVVDPSNLAEMAKDLQPGFIISPSYSQEWVQQNLLKATQ
ncbi:MAG: ABC transporter substrate-binding protein [Rhizobiaceae bacterium]|nr:ABC transporter substrate-binding protein [Rhizobiaceae bacterium]